MKEDFSSKHYNLLIKIKGVLCEDLPKPQQTDRIKYYIEAFEREFEKIDTKKR